MTTLQFLGATRSVTGSCFLLEQGRSHILIDCGLVQGSHEATARNGLPFPLDPSALDAVVLSHAHLDHTGLTPRLMAEGFHGRIVTTGITKELLPVLWDDYVRIQRSDAHASHRGQVPSALYSNREVDAALGRCEGHLYDKVVNLSPSCRVRFLDAGHILGSAIVEVWIDDESRERKLVFSGDLGHRDKPIVRDPTLVTDADVLLLESTYGDRNHKSKADTLAELGHVIAETLSAGGTVLMPVYAIGRSQDVLYMIHQLTLNGILDGPRVFLDSPMAIRAADVYSRHVEVFDEEAVGLMRHPRKNPRAPLVQFTESPAASRALARLNGVIILAGSGMCEGGRIQEHLARHLDDPRSCVIFTGYQVEGTLGRRLVDGLSPVKIRGTLMPVKAKVHTINGLSAHADQTGLLEWVGGFRDPKPQTFLVHGEEQKMTVLAAALQERYGIKAMMPTWQERVIL